MESRRPALIKRIFGVRGNSGQVSKLKAKHEYTWIKTDQDYFVVCELSLMSTLHD